MRDSACDVLANDQAEAEVHSDLELAPGSDDQQK
jgi:hypothetical protein